MTPESLAPILFVIFGVAFAFLMGEFVAQTAEVVLQVIE